MPLLRVIDFKVTVFSINFLQAAELSAAAVISVIINFSFIEKEIKSCYGLDDYSKFFSSR